MAETLIVNVNSMKGGVGKTTIALAIALAGLLEHQEEQLPVVLIDADIFGTELTDLLLPPGPGHGRWSLALLDLLVQSTGGGITVAGLIEQRLQQAVADRTSLPFASPPDLPPLLILPSLAARNPAERLELTAPGPGSPARLDTSLVTESLGRLQLELRLTALVDSILKVIQPRLLILDHAPFHFPLSAVPRCWQDKNQLQRLLLDPAALERWQGCQIRHLEVAGAEHQDLLRFLTVLGDDQRRQEAWKNGTRWLLNRDIHSTGDGLDACNSHRMLPLLVQAWPQLAHLPLHPQLLAGIHGRNLAGITYRHQTDAWTVERLDKDRSTLELITAICRRGQLDPLVFDPDSKRFEPKPWLELLA